MMQNDLQPGAANAVRVCLNIQPHERVTVISDLACRDIGAALIREIEAVGASYASFVLEDEAPRPLAALPASHRRGHGTQRRQHLRGAGPAQRTRLPHGP